MKMNTEFYIISADDGERIGWAVTDNGSNVLCEFYGPMSRSAALSFCRDLRKDTLIGVAEDGYSPKHVSFDNIDLGDTWRTIASHFELEYAGRNNHNRFDWVGRERDITIETQFNPETGESCFTNPEEKGHYGYARKIGATGKFSSDIEWLYRTIHSAFPDVPFRFDRGYI